MENQNPTPNPPPPTENIPAQNPAIETPPQAYTAPQPATPPPSPKPFFSTKIILLIMLLLILLGVGGTYFSLNSKPKPLPAGRQANPISPTSVPTPTPDPTANWKTYTSTESAYSFKYPNDWDTQKVGEKDLMIAPKEIVEQVRNTKGGFGGGVFLTLMIHEDYKPSSNWFNSDETKQVTSADFIVANSPATKYILKFTADVPGTPLGSIITDVVTEKNGKSYAIELLDSSRKQVYDQILSTFKFLDTSTNVGTGCKIGGCSGELCLNEADESVASICIYREGFACYKTAKCEKQANGKCGWTQTPELSLCLNQNPTPTCMKRPACLDATPRCLIAEPAKGWCP